MVGKVIGYRSPVSFSEYLGELRGVVGGDGKLHIVESITLISHEPRSAGLERERKWSVTGTYCFNRRPYH